MHAFICDEKLCSCAISNRCVQKLFEKLREPNDSEQKFVPRCCRESSSLRTLLCAQRSAPCTQLSRLLLCGLLMLARNRA